MQDVGEIHLAVVVPMANERETAVAFLQDVLAHLPAFKKVEILTVFDNVCRDGTKDLVAELSEREPRVRVIWAPQNRNIKDAYMAGHRAALATGADWILEIDAGYSHRPGEIVRFIDALRAGNDVAFGSRFCPGAEMKVDSRQRYIVSKGGTLLTNLLLGTRLADMTSGFQMFTRPALQHVLDKGVQSTGPFFQTEMKFHCRRMKVAEVPITYHATHSAVRRGVLADAFKCLFHLAYTRAVTAG